MNIAPVYLSFDILMTSLSGTNLSEISTFESIWSWTWLAGPHCWDQFNISSGQIYLSLILSISNSPTHSLFHSHASALSIPQLWHWLGLCVLNCMLCHSCFQLSMLLFNVRQDSTFNSSCAWEQMSVLVCVLCVSVCVTACEREREK